jgi:hypothetical protein
MRSTHTFSVALDSCKKPKGATEKCDTKRLRSRAFAIHTGSMQTSAATAPESIPRKEDPHRHVAYQFELDRLQEQFPHPPADRLRRWSWRRRTSLLQIRNPQFPIRSLLYGSPFPKVPVALDPTRLPASAETVSVWPGGKLRIPSIRVLGGGTD